MNIDDPRIYLALRKVTDNNIAIVAMGYDNSNIIISRGDGDKLPDPLVNGSYVWRNISDYANHANDPYAEIVKCIAKVDNTMIVIRSQNWSNKNIIDKTYSMAPISTNTNNIGNIISSDSSATRSHNKMNIVLSYI